MTCVNQPIARNEGLVSVYRALHKFLFYVLITKYYNTQFCPALDDTVSVLGLGWDWKDNFFALV